LKPFLGKVIECRVMSVNNDSINAVFEDMPVRCAMSRVPKPIRGRIKVGSKVPIYMAKVEFDHFEGNFYSKQIPEQLLKSRMSYMSDLYLRCVFRKAGEFSKVISSRRIDRSAIEKIEKLLHERIYVTVLTYEQLENIKDGKLSLKQFIRGRIKP
jgi:hypothetical protein